MAYTAVPTVVTGQLYTAANFNTYFKDNFAASVPDIFTGTGSLAVGSAVDAAGELTVGATDGMVLKASSTDTLGIAWGLDPVNDAVTDAGDLITGTAADTLAILPAGSNYQVLEAASTDTFGLRWGSAIARHHGVSTDWMDNGAGSFAPDKTLFQAGAIDLNPAAVVKVTYPVAYKEIPFTLISPAPFGQSTDATTRVTIYYQNPTTSDIEIGFYHDGVTTDVDAMIGFWMAIGEPN